MSCLEVVCAALVSVSTWMTPMPAHSQGLIVAYGSDSLMDDQFWYRGYNRSGYLGGVAVVTPAHLGRVVWLRTDGQWIGPLLVVDVMARHHFYRGVYVIHEIAEVSDEVRQLLHFRNGTHGEMFIGACPPRDREDRGQPYDPPLIWDRGDRQPLFWPYPVQQKVFRCSLLS